MSMSSVEELQFAMHRAAYSHNDVKLIITLTRNSSKPGNSKTQQGFQLNTHSTLGILMACILTAIKMLHKLFGLTTKLLSDPVSQGAALL